MIMIFSSESLEVQLLWVRGELETEVRNHKWTPTAAGLSLALILELLWILTDVSWVPTEVVVVREKDGSWFTKKELAKKATPHAYNLGNWSPRELE